MKRPGYISGWRLGEVTGDNARATRQLNKKLSKIDDKIAKAEAKLAELEAKKASSGISGWLAGWF